MHVIDSLLILFEIRYMFANGALIVKLCTDLDSVYKASIYLNILHILKSLYYKVILHA